MGIEVLKCALIKEKSNCQNIVMWIKFEYILVKCECKIQKHVDEVNLNEFYS